MKIGRARIDIRRWLLLRMNFLFTWWILNLVVILLSAGSSYVRTMNHYMCIIHRCILLTLTSLGAISLKVNFATTSADQV